MRLATIQKHVCLKIMHEKITTRAKARLARSRMDD